MKKYSLLYILGGAAVLWWLMKNKKKGPAAASAQAAAETAKQIVASDIDQTTFLPDTTTFKTLYQQDQSACK